MVGILRASYGKVTPTSEGYRLGPEQTYENETRMTMFPKSVRFPPVCLYGFSRKSKTKTVKLKVQRFSVSKTFGGKNHQLVL